MPIAFHLDRRERDSSRSDGSTIADLARMAVPGKINCLRWRRFHIQAGMAVVLVNVAQAKQGILDVRTCFVALAYFAAYIKASKMLTHPRLEKISNISNASRA
ncbi:hypothetical protein [Agrobacterium vitis]|uniref:hypothetical protein n=1 Tax=Agrobacterium vitis TaxID=373 RepID=UPI001574980B|nr:hypothetical protein [Agrobacterium vitis]NSZ15806.1 hypothetical protein [Agrobacterium vitis]QZO04614.1 hypothetical protein K4831_03380 [Agrobacterium vitis]UJL86758.1 hypothetical protein AVF2S5_01715 [Agrobacterium vitis]